MKHGQRQRIDMTLDQLPTLLFCIIRSCKTLAPIYFISTITLFSERIIGINPVPRTLLPVSHGVYDEKITFHQVSPSSSLATTGPDEGMGGRPWPHLLCRSNASSYSDDHLAQDATWPGDERLQDFRGNSCVCFFYHSLKERASWFTKWTTLK